MSDYWLLEWLGGFHPLVVHFPIGLLIVAFCMECCTIRGRHSGLRDGITWMVYIGTASAVLASSLGWFLIKSGNYGTGAAQVHQWLGFTTALMAGGVAVLMHRARQTCQSSAWLQYRVAFALCCLVLAITGHYGAILTHGSDYLTWERSSSVTGQLVSEFSGKDLSPRELDRLNLEVRALFAHRCYRCHSSDRQEADLRLDTEEGVRRGGETGVILVPGLADNSEIIRRLELPRTNDEAMPQKGKPLAQEEIDLVRLWINLGSHWADEDLQIFPEAPLALLRPEVPEGMHPHPVDRFMDVYFEEQGIRWPDPVDDRTFMRRATLDITGLLPTPETLEAFLQREDPHKRVQLVEELLAATHSYAQHWLSFWNDLLRNDYSGTGYITGGRKQITPWLYEALLTNRSYNDMVRELLNPAPASEGFIRGIQWRGVANNSQRVEMQAAQNVSQSLLGVNVKCASCHDSFVSNLTLDQAYGFATVFADTVLEILRCDKPTGRMSHPAFLYEELGVIQGETVQGRLEELAEIVVQPANGRLYRTMANRLWDRLMGRGLVMPVDEMDNTPWNAELLDFLAAELMAGGSDVKAFLRLVMTSETYQLPSISAEEDPFVFYGPLRRRLSAEQFSDALSQIMVPVYYNVAYDPEGEDFDAAWIWFREREVDRDVLPQPGVRYFRHTFEVAGSVEEARMLVAADDAYKLYLNGERIAQGDDIRVITDLDIGALLHVGSNTLAVRGENTGSLRNPAGVLFNVRIVLRDGAEQTVVSGPDWLATDQSPAEDWILPAYDDSEWEMARSYGRFGEGHWGRLVDFRYAEHREHLPFARASLVVLDPFLRALGRPTRENVVTRRDDEATLLQALELTNGVFFNEVLRRGAAAWIERHGDDPAMLIDRFYHATLGRTPGRAERKLLGETASPEAVEDMFWAVFLSPEFQLIY